MTPSTTMKTRRIPSTLARSAARTSSVWLLRSFDDSVITALMKLRRWASGILVAVLLTLHAVAYASPPDPTWIAGLWDDGDYDDVVILVASTAAISDMNLVVNLGVVVPVVASVPTPEPQSFSTDTFSPNASRAPPSPA